MSYWNIIISEAATNLVVNSSFETGTASWSTGGTNTIAQSTEQSKYGANSLKITYSDNVTLAQSSALTLTAAAHTFSCWLYITSDYDGTNLQIRFINFTGITGGGLVSADMTITDTWQRIETTGTIAGGDLVGNLQLRESGSVPTAGNVYLDGVDCTIGSYSTTHIDGDQPGSKWNGIPHASTSTRDQFEATGGRVYDLSDDLGFIIASEDGTGIPPVNNISSSLALQPGELFDGQTINGRNMILTGSIVGTSYANFHVQRQAIIKALNANTVKIGQRSQARRFRYTGAAVDKEIDAVYDGGLEFGAPDGFAKHGIQLRLKANDPLFYQVGETAAALDVNDSATARAVAGRIDGLWSVLGPPDAAGSYSSIRTIHKGWDGKIYFGGAFTNFDNIANADRIVSYDPNDGTWAALSTGADNTVYSIIDGPDDSIYVGGAFSVIGGVTCRGVAKWDGSSFTALGPPSSGGGVFDLAFADDGTLYVVGSFTNWDGDANADYIASWDGSAWSPVGTGANNNIYTIAVFGDNIYVAGDFTSIGGTAANYIAYYDGSAYNAMGTGLGSSGTPIGYALTASPDGIIYIGGSFDTADGVTVNNIASWNGATFSALSSGLDGGVSSLIYRNGSLFMSGSFDTASGMTLTTRAAQWNGSSWLNIDVNVPGTPTIYAITATDNDDIYLGYDTTGTLAYSGNATVSYTGTYNAYPRIEMKRSGGAATTLYSIRNITTGAELFFNYAFDDGESAILDLTHGKTTFISSFKGDVYSKLLTGSNVGNFYLLSGNGSSGQDNVFTAYASNVSTGLAVNLIWKDTYISED